MAKQNSPQNTQQSPTDGNAESQLPTRSDSDWETPSIDFLDLGLEVTAYVYHWD
jgi:coenzyme PQQ precursor peptide PqqA